MVKTMGDTHYTFFLFIPPVKKVFQIFYKGNQSSKKKTRRFWGGFGFPLTLDIGASPILRF